MPGRLDVLAFLQEAAAKLRQMARQHPSAASPEMLRIADDIAREAARLEAEIINAELISPPAANHN